MERPGAGGGGPVAGAAGGGCARLVAHPAPLAAETAASALWPEAPWGPDLRQRLNTVMHRLRQGLGPAGTAVGRVGDMLTLAPDRWDVDLFRLRRALRRAPDGGDGGSPLADALTDVSGNLGHVQFPYDEQLVDERHAIVAAVLRRLDTGGGLGVPDVTGLAQKDCLEALRALGVPPS